MISAIFNSWREPIRFIFPAGSPELSLVGLLPVNVNVLVFSVANMKINRFRITSYNVCYTKLLRNTNAVAAVQPSGTATNATVVVQPKPYAAAVNSVIEAIKNRQTQSVRRLFTASYNFV